MTVNVRKISRISAPESGLRRFEDIDIVCGQLSKQLVNLLGGANIVGEREAIEAPSLRGRDCQADVLGQLADFIKGERIPAQIEEDAVLAIIGLPTQHVSVETP
jgi:hypothetical protein